MIDYESRAIMSNPFKGLSSEECCRMMVYFTVVREPVMTQAEVKSRWNVEIPSEQQLPVFRVAEIAEEIRGEIRVKSRQTSKFKGFCVALGLALLVSIVALSRMGLALRTSIAKHSDVCKSYNNLCNAFEYMRSSYEQELSATNAAFKCMRSSYEQELSVTNAALAVLRGVVAGIIDKHDQGDISACMVISQIKDLLGQKSCIGVSYSNVCESARGLMESAGLALHSGDQKQCFDVGIKIECFLAKYAKEASKRSLMIDEGMKSDLVNLMKQCYENAAVTIPEAYYRMALLYGASSLDRFVTYDGYVICSNNEVAKRYLHLACDKNDISALRLKFGIMIHDPCRNKWGADEFLGCVAIGKAIAENGKATGDDVCTVAMWFTSCYSEDKKRDAERYFKIAAQRGSVAAKKWLIDRGMSY